MQYCNQNNSEQYMFPQIILSTICWADAWIKMHTTYSLALCQNCNYGFIIMFI